VSLAFLSPSSAAAAPARSPLMDAAESAGAMTEVRHGWEVIASFGDPGAERAACAEAVGFADLSYLTKLELQGSRPVLAELLDDLKLGAARRQEEGWVCPIAPTLALVLGAPEAEATISRRFDREGVRACDLTGSLAALAIVGPRARDTFARFCALDLRPAATPLSGFRPASVARTPGYVLREGPDRFLMLFGAALGAYMWEVVADAAGGLGGRPVGVDALPALEKEPAHA
jgi:glycine cleavage system aminomethyltransferase T